MKRTTAFNPAALTFLRRLKRNNNRAWFAANRTAYEQAVRDPMRALVEELDVWLARSGPEIVGDPRRSVFRIHRDVRFSKDKSPYKTNAGCWFYHRDAGKGVSGEGSVGAGFYFHLEPAACFVAAGIWMPPRPALDRIRAVIADDPDDFAALVGAPAFVRRFRGLDRELLLRRLPRGYAPGHPAEAWLRFTSFTASRAYPDDLVTSPRLTGQLQRDFSALLPLVRWLNRALGYPPARSRL